MKRISGQRLGLWSLRLDAIYCILLGAGVSLGAPRIAQVVAFPPALLVVAGTLVVTWAGLVLWMLSRLRLRWALRTVMVVNIGAALLVAVCAAAAATMLVVLAVLAVAVDVALFAASQAVALRTLPAAQAG